MGFEQQVDQWREFYLAVAGAAAVLLGLVFVALSLHLEKAEAPGIPVLGLGSQALINLIYVLLLSLGMLAPTGRRSCPGSRSWPLPRSGSTARRPRAAGAAGTQATPDDHELGGPVVLPIVCFVLLVVGGVGVIARQPYGLYLLAAGSAALIASATRSTWTLLLFGRTQSLE
jgi:hypothetical protein